MLQMDIGHVHFRNKPRDALSNLDNETTDAIFVKQEPLDDTRHHFSKGDVFNPEEWLVQYSRF